MILQGNAYRFAPKLAEEEFAPTYAVSQELWKKNTEVTYWLDMGPLPVTVPTKIITFLVGTRYQPSFATVTGRARPIYTPFEV